MKRTRVRVALLAVALTGGVLPLAGVSQQQEDQRGTPPPILPAIDPGAAVSPSADSPQDEQRSTLVPLRPGTRFHQFIVGRGDPAGPVDIGEVLPLRPSTKFRRLVSRAGKTDGSVATVTTGTTVYSNRLGISIYSPGGPPGALVADDVATTVSEGCLLESLRFRVSGDVQGPDGSGVGPYGVSFALYSVCPGALFDELDAGALFPPITVNFPDNGDYEVILKVAPNTCIGGTDHGLACTADDDCADGGICGLEVPRNLYFGVQFSRSLAGIVAGAPATLGISADRFDFPGSTCTASFGGFPGFPHASFDLEITVHDDCPGGVCDGTCIGGDQDGLLCTTDCPAGFPAYKNTQQGAGPFTTVPAYTFFADDITLTNPCLMVAFEVGFRGAGSSSGSVQAALHTALDDEDPERGHRIPGSRVQAFVSGSALRMLSTTFDPPVVLTDPTLYVVYETGTDRVGPIATCKKAVVGSTEDVYFRYEGKTYGVPPFEGQWAEADLGDTCWSGFEVSITCAGPPPSGACCDVRLTEDRICIGGANDGSPCTRDSHCKACAGGDNHGSPCDEDADCPDGRCPDFGETVCAGDAVCRELPMMNCATPRAWVEGAHCGPVCNGGANDEQACATDEDCPPACVGGLRDGQACGSEAECPGECTSTGGDGPREGEPCWNGVECQLFPEFPNPNWTCSSGSCGEPGKCHGSFCEGGENDGLPCTRQADCPGGDCIGQPFDYGLACGLGKCCTANDLQCCLTEKECYTDGSLCQNERLEVPVVYDPTQVCDMNYCPIGTCFDAEGDCKFARVGEVGCENDFCCDAVCRFDAYCCEVEWDASCVRWSQAFGDMCFGSPHNDSCNEAYSIQVDESAVVETSRATSDSGDPGSCCRDDNPGAPGYASVWFTFVATETSARVHTCNTEPPVEDLLLQVFRAADLSTPETACGSLDYLACNDDTLGCGEGLLADVCVTGLNSGETYYVMVAGKTPDDTGVIRIDVESPCSLDISALPNDVCSNAVRLDDTHADCGPDSGGCTDCGSGDCSTPFDLDGAGFWSPATFDCPGLDPDNCLDTMKNDIWYDWWAPATGRVSMETCDQDLVDGDQTQETTLALYYGCDCPVERGAELDCDSFGGYPDRCSLGSIISAPVKRGQCYKVRLGGRLGGLPSGNLTIDFQQCPPGPVTFVEPPDGTVDARQPYAPSVPDPTDPAVLQGIDSITVRWPGGSVAPFCHRYCETPIDGYPSNLINKMVDNGDDTFTLDLARAIAPGAVATVTFLHGGGAISLVTVMSHPGNVDATGPTDLTDLEALVDAVNGLAKFDKYSHDMDHSEMLTPRDLLRWIDLANGADQFEPWLGTPLPDCGECCP